MRRKLLKTQLKIKNIEKLSEGTNHYYSAVGIDNMTFRSFESQKDTIFRKMRSEILNNNYKFVRYKEKLIIKNRKSLPRCISIPTLKDRLTLKIVLETLKEYFPECARTKLPTECIKEIKYNMENNHYDYFIKLDLSNFYGNINHTLLAKILKKRIKDKLLIELIMRAIKTPTVPEVDFVENGVPQGLSISNILSQIYMLEFDNIKGLDCHMTRFVDDIIILCDEINAKTVYNKIISYLENDLKLVLNKNKEDQNLLLKKGFDYLGYRISLNKKEEPVFSVKKQNIFRIEKRLVDLITRYKHQSKESNGFSTEALIFELNIMIAGTISGVIDGTANKKRYGWTFFYSQINDLNRLYHLDNLVNNKLKEINFPNKDIKKVKKFSKAYYEIRYNLKNTNYIFRPDNYTLIEKGLLLKRLYNINLTKDEEIERMFRKVVFRKIKINERDVIHDIS